MANGLFGKCITVANTDINVYTVSSSNTISFASLNISCVNTGLTEAKVSIAISASSTPTAQDWIEYEYILEEQSSTLERTAIVCSPGEHIIVRSNSNSVVVRIHGLEQAVC